VFILYVSFSSWHIPCNENNAAVGRDLSVIIYSTKHWMFGKTVVIMGTYLLRWIHACNVTTYRNTVSWQCGRGSWPRNVSNVGYVVTLRACSVRGRYLAVASKGWYGYGLSRSGRATWHVTIVRSSRLLCLHDASGSRNKLGTPWSNARRILLRHEARNGSSDRNSVSFQSLASRRYGTR
jgi:hypothetical protein